MSAKRKFSDVEDETLISFVESHPELYDANDRNYKNLALRENLWREYANSVGRNGEYFVCEFRVVFICNSLFMFISSCWMQKKVEIESRLFHTMHEEWFRCSWQSIEFSD